MKKENFDKGIEELKALRLTSAEKASMLESILKTPLASPYIEETMMFAFARRFSTAIAITLVVVLATSTTAFASLRSLPGDRLYPVKVTMVEPLRGVLAVTQEEKLEWDVELVVRRLAEAEKLAEEDRLEEHAVKKLKKEIERSAAAFAQMADRISMKSATTTEGRKEKRAELNRLLMERIGSLDEESKDVDSKMETGDEAGDSNEGRDDVYTKIRGLKENALKALEDNKDEQEDDDKQAETEELKDVVATATPAVTATVTPVVKATAPAVTATVTPAVTATTTVTPTLIPLVVPVLAPVVTATVTPTVTP